MTSQARCNSSTPAAETGGEPDSRGRDRSEILLDAEVRRLVRELRPFGVLTAHQLARLAGAAHWHSSTFEAALRAGERRGQLVRLPFEFVGLRSDDDAPGRPQRTVAPRVRSAPNHRIIERLHSNRRKHAANTTDSCSTSPEPPPPARDLS